jgi:hypothetical protein
VFAVRVQLRGRPSRWSSSGQSARPAVIPGRGRDCRRSFAAAASAKGSRVQQVPELFLDLPGGLERAGRIIGAEDRAEPGASTVRERITGPQQQPPVGPDRIRAASLNRVCLEDRPGATISFTSHDAQPKPEPPRPLPRPP